MNGYLNNMIRPDIIEMYASWSNDHYSFCMHSFVCVFRNNGGIFSHFGLENWFFE